MLFTQQRKNVHQPCPLALSCCDCEILSAVRLMHERELFGGRVRAGSLGGEPVMRAERVWSVRSSAAAAAEGPFECRSRFMPFGILSRE